MSSVGPSISRYVHVGWQFCVVEAKRAFYPLQSVDFMLMPPDPVECGASMISFGVTNRTFQIYFYRITPLQFLVNFYEEIAQWQSCRRQRDSTPSTWRQVPSAPKVAGNVMRPNLEKKVEMNFKFGATFAWRHVKSMKVPPVGLVAPATSKDSTEPVAVDWIEHAEHFKNQIISKIETLLSNSKMAHSSKYVNSRFLMIALR